jgi:prepilin-type N-terminal cleavage/methylation domain-containing protein
MMKFLNKKNRGFTRLVDFGDAILSRTKSASPKLTTGFTLVETLVAVSIFSVSVISLISFLGSSIANTNYAKNKIIATYLAQEGIEYIRNMRDTYVLYPANGGWNGFKTLISSCVSANGCGFDSSALPADSIFQCAGAPAGRCKLYLDNGNYNTNSSGVDSGFTRVILRELVGGGGSEEVKIISTVSWNTGSTVHSVSFSENLFNWVELE